MSKSRIEDLIDKKVIASWRANSKENDFYPKAVSSLLELVEPKFVGEQIDEKIKELFFGAINKVSLQIVLLKIIMISPDVGDFKIPQILESLDLHLDNLIILIEYMGEKLDDESLEEVLNMIKYYKSEVNQIFFPNAESLDAEQDISVSDKMIEWRSLGEENNLSGNLAIYEEEFLRRLNNLYKNKTVSKTNNNFEKIVTGAFLKIRKLEDIRDKTAIKRGRRKAIENIKSEVLFLIEYLKILQVSFPSFSLNYLDSILKKVFLLDNIDIE